MKRTPLKRSTKRIKNTNAYQKSPWLALVRQVRKRSRGICEVCGDAPAVGQPHHRAYQEGMVGWKRLIVPLDQLVDCCRSCHLAFHGNPEGLFS
jgi:hypothetical protein